MIRGAITAKFVEAEFRLTSPAGMKYGLSQMTLSTAAFGFWFSGYFYPAENSAP